MSGVEDGRSPSNRSSAKSTVHVHHNIDAKAMKTIFSISRWQNRSLLELLCSKHN
jgi:hypothetical protein